LAAAALAISLRRVLLNEAARAFTPPAEALRSLGLAVVSREVFLLFPGQETHDLDGVADHVGGALLAFVTLGHRPHHSLIRSIRNAYRQVLTTVNVYLDFRAETATWEGSQLRARNLISSASFGPLTLKVIGQAFDEAWSEIAGNYGSDPLDIDSARYTLANAVLAVAREDSRDVEALKRDALAALALGYRKGPVDEPKISN